MKKLLPTILFMSSTIFSANASDILLELFTSQGCYSCPPAEKLIYEKYSKASNIIALEFHVDYWDDLIYGSAGSWKDPFSSSQYTERQTNYNKKIRKTRSVYTPQVVVNGTHEAVGSSEGKIDLLISQASNEVKDPSTLGVTFENNAQQGFIVNLKGSINDTDSLNYAIYQLAAETKVPSGENKGKTLNSHNVVTDFQFVNASKRKIIVPEFNAETHGCAIWVQRHTAGRVLLAKRCPS